MLKLDRGDTIEVRAFGNDILVRRVWKTTAERVFISTDEQYAKRLADDPNALEPVGFPLEDVIRKCGT